MQRQQAINARQVGSLNFRIPSGWSETSESTTNDFVMRRNDNLDILFEVQITKISESTESRWGKAAKDLKNWYGTEFQAQSMYFLNGIYSFSNTPVLRYQFYLKMKSKAYLGQKTWRDRVVYGFHKNGYDYMVLFSRPYSTSIDFLTVFGDIWFSLS